MTPRIFSSIMAVSGFLCFIALSYKLLTPPKQECNIIPGYVETCPKE